MSGTAIISGGSIGGLFVAAALRRIGWQVDIYERSDIGLSGRGAGIVTHRQLTDALSAVGADIRDLGVDIHERVVFDKEGDRVRSLPYDQVVTSWDRLHRLLRDLVPDDRFHLGKCITGYRRNGAAVRAAFTDGSSAEADILVGADGFRSAIREHMLPAVQPNYSGYVVWRALASEADLSTRFRDNMFDVFGFFLPFGEQALGYPIAGPGNDLRVGARRYNFVWYTRVSDDELTDMLTDAGGNVHAMSIPPPLVRDDVLARMRDRAETRLSRPFVDVLARSGRPFFTPIYDYHSPVMAEGRVALAGDAACVARPHVGMGVTKAAEDALALARHLSAAAAEPALAAYSDERVPACHAAYARSRRLGGYIFDAPETGQNSDGRSHPRVGKILRETATADF